MAIKITEECINCGACEPECPNNAIYEAGAAWAIADGNNCNREFYSSRTELYWMPVKNKTPFSRCIL
jgi:ferredoxin